mmetsp:Transcript_30836/g.82049  ORF Transcript_30836/g.82049 Transcript_30836/m.82049 type:complete len:246 (+) Transcript_30836:555-1292(+)
MKMNSCARSLWGNLLKKRCVTGTAPRAPWMVALGKVDRKQKTTSGRSSFHLRPRAFIVNVIPKKTPAKRNDSPTSITGRTLYSCVMIAGVVLLPNMLNRNSWPKTQTPPSMPSTSCSSLGSVYEAKQLPVTITSSSGWNMEPGLKPIGISSFPWSDAPPRPKAVSATESTIRNASTAEPENTCRRLHRSAVRMGMSHPATPPRKAPTAIVAITRSTFPTTRSPRCTSGWCAGADIPTRMPKTVRA